MKKVFTSNVLKLIACFTMLLDHIGKIIYLFFPTDTNYWIDYSFSIIGRFAFPIYVFLLIEGFYHTKNIKKYFLRLGIMAIVIGLAEIILAAIPDLALTNTLLKAGNIFIDLLLILLTLFLFNNKNKELKIFAIFPIGYFILCLFIQNGMIHIFNNPLKILLTGFMSQYSFVSPILIVLFILIHLLYTNIIHKKYSDEDLKTININALNRDIRTNSFILAVTVFALLSYLLTYFISDSSIINTDCVINTYFILSIFVIYFYNGKLGKTNIYIKSAYYLFYPLHLGIIFLLTYLISLI